MQAAVDAANNGDTIYILPGVYVPFTVDGTDNLTISGAYPDAVFVDGGGGAFVARIQNATGVALQDLTLRNAANAVELVNAGAGGYNNQSLRTNLQSLLIYHVTTTPVIMS